MSRVVLLTTANPDQITGGNLYNHRMVAALTANGIAIEIRDAILATPLRVESDTTIIVDSIALKEAEEMLTWTGRTPRIILLLHMLPSDVADTEEVPGLRSLQDRWIRAADAVVTVGPDLQRRVTQTGKSVDQVHLIPPGRNGIPFLPRNRRGPPRFLCIANWSKSKGIQEAVVAVTSAARNYALDLVGAEGNESYAAEVRETIASQGAQDRVHIAGVLGSEAVAEYFASAVVFILPSRHEGFGTVYAEALHCGLPIIAYDVEPVKWLVPPSCGLLVRPGDQSGLTSAARTLGGDVGKRERMAEASLQRARELPTWEQSMRMLVTLVGTGLAITAGNPIRQ